MESGRKVPSYLQARDPSLVYYPNYGNVHKLNLADISEFNTDDEEPSFKEETLRNIQIYLRVKKINNMGPFYELDGNKLNCVVPVGCNSNRNVHNGQCMKRSYTFSHIFGPQSTQEEVFNRVVKPKLVDVINGKNSTLMAYGASGVGKTYTIVGTADHPGVIPRALEYLFGSIPRLAECPKVKPVVGGNIMLLTESLQEFERTARNKLIATLNGTIDKEHLDTYKLMQNRLSNVPVAEIKQQGDVAISVWISYAEIYNEQIFDLLSYEPVKGKSINRKRLQLGKSNDTTYIKNLTNISVTNSVEAYQILRYGLNNLNYAATAINSHSSRSHSIFTITLVQTLETDSNESESEYCVSYFNFCDLAGSERLKRTLNAGDRLKESNNINTSLMVLGRCISLIRDGQLKKDYNRLVPYRESKLTMLFQQALSGKEDMAMIVNINPSVEMFDESMQVLNFSAIVKKIEISKRTEQPLKSKQEYLDDSITEKVRLLQEDNDKLRDIITDMQIEKEEAYHEFQEQADQRILDYRKLMDNIEEHWRNKLKFLEERLEEEKNNALENLREEYEEQFRAKRYKSVGGVVNLDSDCEDEEDEKYVELKKRYNELQAEVTKLKFDCKHLECELAQAKEKISDLDEENRELTLQLLPLNDVSRISF